MIRHIVFFSARSDEDRAAIEAGLSLLTVIPHALTLEVGTNVKKDQLGNEVDFVVYGEFADDAAFAAYKADATYAESIGVVRAKRDLRIAADFLLD